MSFAHVVLVGPGVAHLDRAYTYRVPDGASVEVGSIVRVPVRGRSREGVVVALLGEPDVARVQPMRAVLGPGLTPEVVAVCADVAAHYLTSFGEALTAALPPRVAAEEASPDAWPALPAVPPDPDAFGAYRGGRALFSSVTTHGYRAFAWRPLAQESRGAPIASLAAAALGAGRGVLVLVPEVGGPSSVAEALAKAFGAAVAWVGSDRSDRERYRAWLALRRGDARLAAGGRSAVFAPVANLGLVVVDDESHVSYKSRRAPKLHARSVAAGRARAAGATFLAVGVPPSAEVQHAIERRTLASVSPSRAVEVRTRPPVVVVDRSKSSDRHVPTAKTLQAVKAALDSDRRAVLLIHKVGEEARAIAQRAMRILGPRRPARLDARVLTRDPDAFARAVAESDLIVSSPVIAKDLALSGVGCVAIVEADAALASPEFRAVEEAFATWWRAGRWLGRDGSLVVETSMPRASAIAALVRWDPDALWRADGARRAELGYPPFAALVRIEAPAGRVETAASEIAAAAPEAEILGPVEHGNRSVLAVRAHDRAALLTNLAPLAAAWRAEGADVVVDVDPREVLP